MKKLSFAVAVLTLLSTALPAISVGDLALSLPVAAKAALPLALIPSAFQDPESIPVTAAALGLLTVPNTALLYNVATGNASGTAFWRNIVRITDGVSTVALAGYGAYLLSGSGGGSWDDVVGVLVMAAAVPLAVSFGLDFIPFSAER